MKTLISNLRYNPNSKDLDTLLNLDSFKTYCNDLLVSNNGTQCQIMIQYIKDVSSQLALVSAVGENSIELHVVAERALLIKCFTFNHVHYVRYLTAQHVHFDRMQIYKSDTWEDLVKNGFGGSLTGHPFSTETTINREVKVRGGSMRGFSTSEATNDQSLNGKDMV